ncbi:50S ribosomal protein L23 [Desulfatirhabdium butyrativorans]|uniref:50S ribosomal protein L23 n=1 Tax=Desulfatirhabdium butyrativorans TaxID=340467 RepID=UPI0003FF90BD|nr:50S ribosomal protein L23 [Desulfatirhabdium butyrativorans]
MNYIEILKRPVLTEKSNIQKETANQVTFEVASQANRIQIQQAVETAFKVKVESVNTMHVRGKLKRRGRIVGKQRNWKKAIVKLAPNQRIEIFEGI